MTDFTHHSQTQQGKLKKFFFLNLGVGSEESWDKETPWRQKQAYGKSYLKHKC